MWTPHFFACILNRIARLAFLFEKKNKKKILNMTIVGKMGL